MAKFEIVIRNQGQAGGGSSGRASTSSANPAKQAERDAKAAEAAAKRYASVQEAAYNKIAATQARIAKQAADNQAKEAKRAADALVKESERAATAQIKEAKRAADQIAGYQKSQVQKNRFSFQGAGASGIAGLDKTFSQRAAASKAYAASVSKDIDSIFGNWQKEASKEEALAVKTANAKIREDNKTAASAERAAKRQADANAKEDARAASARAKFTARAGKAIGGAATSIGYGAYRAAGQLGGGISAAGSELASGGLTGILGSAPRALGDIVGGAGQAAGSIARGISTGLATALSAAGPIGIVTGAVVKLLGNAFAVVGEVAGALGKAAGELAGFIGDQLGTALKVSLGTAVGIGILGIKQALEQEDISEAFERYAKVVGEDAVDATEKLRAATKGMVSDLDLQRAANQAIQGESVKTIDEFEKLAAVAVPLGKAIGKGPKEAIDDFTKALSSGNAKALRPYIGTLADFKDAINEESGELGVSSTALDGASARQARYNALIEAATTAVGKLGPQTGNTSDSFDRLKASVENSLNSIGKSLLPALKSVLDTVEPIAKAIGTFFDNNNKQISEAISNAIGGIVGDLRDLPNIISTIKLDQVFSLAQLESKKLWIEFATYGKAALDFILDQTKALYAESKALALDAAAAISPVGYDNPRATELRGEASGLRERSLGRFANATAALGKDPAIADLDKTLNALIETIKGQATKPFGVGFSGGGSSGGGAGATFGIPEVPSTGVVQGPPTGTFGSIGSFFNFSGSKSGTSGGSSGGSGGDNDIFTLAAALNGELRLMNKGLASAVEELDLSDEQLAKISENFAHNDFAEQFQRYKDDQTAALRTQLDGAEQQKKYWEDTIAELGSSAKIQEEYSSKRQAALDAQVKAEEDIATEIEAKKGDIVGGFKAAMDEIASRVKSAADSLRSASGFGGDFGGADLNAAIPGKLKRAARKASRRATRSLRHELNQQIAGQGDEDLINGGAEAAFQNVAQKQVLGVEGGANQAQKALDEALNKLSDLTNEKDAQLQALTEETTTTLELLQQSENRQIDALNTAIDKLSAVADNQADIEKRLTRAEKDLDAINIDGRRS